MAFQDLVDLGTFLDSSIQHGSVSDALGLMDLFRHLVALVMRYAPCRCMLGRQDTDKQGK